MVDENQGPATRRKALKSLAAAGIGTTALTGVGTAENGENNETDKHETTAKNCNGQVGANYKGEKEVSFVEKEEISIDYGDVVREIAENDEFRTLDDTLIIGLPYAADLAIERGNPVVVKMRVAGVTMVEGELSRDNPKTTLNFVDFGVMKADITIEAEYDGFIADSVTYSGEVCNFGFSGWTCRDASGTVDL